MNARKDSSLATPWLERDFVFVGGMHRSGTTLLAKIIASSKDSTGLESSGAHMGEGQFLQDVYPIGRAYGGTNSWALDPQSHFTEAEARETPDGARRLWTSWSEFWDLDKPVFVEKTPLNLTKTLFLQEYFPRSKFVIVTRHPVTQSLAVRKWSRTRLRKKGLHFERIVENWLTAHETFRTDQEKLRQVLVIRYENLVANPNAEIVRLEEFLGMTFPGMADEFDGSRASSYEEQWNRVTSWRGLGVAGIESKTGAALEHVLMSHAKRRMNREFGDRIRALGYELDDLRHVDAWPSLRTT